MKSKIMGALMGVILLLNCCGMPVYAETASKILVPEGFINGDSDITVITDKNVVRIRAKQDYGAYKDITDSRSFKADGNGTLYVKIDYLDEDGVEHTEELKEEIKNFDSDEPKLSAYIEGEQLKIISNDSISGTKLINIDGKDFDGADIGINLKELQHKKEEIAVYSIDNAGNKSEVYKVDNPYYVGEETQSSSDKSVNNPQSTKPSNVTNSVAVIEEHTDDEGENLTNITYKEWQEGLGDLGGKQFFTIKTKTDKVFYLVVDETDYQKEAYLLTEVSENDLLNFVNYDGNRVEGGETTLYTIADNTEIAEPLAVLEPVVQEPQKSSKSSIIIVILALAVVGIIYFVKFRNKSPKDEEEDEEDFEESDFDSDIYRG